MTDECLCMKSASAKVKKLEVGGQIVGIINLDGIMEEVHGLGLNGEKAGRELLKRASVYNYIPSSAREDYLGVLLKEYERRYG